MKLAYSVIAVGALAAAAQAGLRDKLPPEAYRDPIDQQIARTGKGLPGRPSPCAHEYVENGVDTIESTPTALCYKMLPQQRWRGIWVNGQESSIFCPEPAGTCGIKTAGAARLENGPGRAGYGSVYRVDFIGRRTMYRGNYDGLGMVDQIILMDHPISIELMSASPITRIRKCGAASGVRRAQVRWCFEADRKD